MVGSSPCRLVVSGYIDLSFPFFFSFSFPFLSFPFLPRPSVPLLRNIERNSRETHREGEDDNRVLFFWLCVTPQTGVTPTFDVRKTQLRVDAGEFFERKEERWPLTRPTDTSSSTMLDTGRKGKGGGDGRTPTSLLVRTAALADSFVGYPVCFLRVSWILFSLSFFFTSKISSVSFPFFNEQLLRYLWK